YRVDGVRIIAPRKLSSGRLYFDCVCFNFMSRGPRPDYQQPWAGKPELLKHPERLLYESHDISLNRPWLPPLIPRTRISERTMNELALIEQRALARIAFRNQLPPHSIDELRREFAQLEIRRNGDIITGRPLNTGGFYDALPNAVSFSTWMTVLRRACTLYRSAKRSRNRNVANEALQMFFDLCDYLIDQGATEGNANVGGMFSGYQLRYWHPHVMDMRDELRATGRLRKMALTVAWFLGGSIMFMEKPSFDTDTLSNGIRNLLAAIMLLPDPSEKLQRLRALQRMFNLVLTSNYPVGLDGVVIHHGMHHLAYASYSMPAAFGIFEMLRDTQFQFNPQVHERLRTYVYATAFSANKYTVPPNMNGRAGTPLQINVAPLARIMAKAGTPDGRERIDREMAQIFLWLNASPNDPIAKEFITMGLKPKPPTGHWTLNGASAALHRRDEWLVAIVGMNRFKRGLEIYGWLENNNYGRYARNGSICIISCGEPPSVYASGYSFEGWNWCHWAGATSLIRPSYELYDYYRMYGNPSAIAGGTSLDGDGIWGMDFR
ncbi:MAG TPA: hypothetical protein EYP10_06505, partial [Armatimonadetes bacterium]|nr:hypothetical protein [Armatimonadota bacterium]